MTTVRNSAWWERFVQRLRTEPLDDLAREMEADPVELERALTLADPGGSATDAPWWPEAARAVQQGASLRATSRRFGTNPRRLRRGLARAGLRVGGRDVSHDGVPELADLRDQLGRVPDTSLADEAGVPVEAVQGERRRHGISSYRPAPASAKVVATPRKRLPRRRRAPTPAAEPVETEVIRRSPPRRLQASRAPAPVPTPTSGLPGGLPTLPKRPTEPQPERRRRRRIVRSDPRDDADEG